MGKSMSRHIRILLPLQLTLAMTLGFIRPAAAEPSGAAPETHTLEAIIVTAQKREQNINDVGIAITAFDSQTIKELAFSQPSDVANSVSNMSVSTLLTNVPNFSIRGVGVNDYAINQPTSVGVYVDQVFMASPSLLLFQLFDTEHIEVLKGPQGTLYGRNTTGGAVLFNSRGPTDTFEASNYDEVGNYGYYSVEGAISGPLSDTVSARVAFSTTQSDGYQKNLTSGNTNGGIDRVSVRGMVDWKPVDGLKIRLNVHGGVDKSNLIALNAAGLGDSTHTSGAIDTVDGVPYRHNDGRGASLIADWNLGPVVLTSVSSYDQLHRFEYQDEDGRAFPGLIDGVLTSYIRQMSQELRLASAGKGPLTWVGGLYYSKDQITDDTDYQLGGAGFPPAAFGIPSVYPVVNDLGNTYFQNTRSRAMFGQVEYDLAEKWHLTGGLRYTKEDKTLSNVTTPYVVNPGPGQIGAPDTGLLFPAASFSRSFDATSGKVGVDYRINKGMLLYGSVSRGFKSGGFPGTLVFSATNLHFFDPETVLDYEVGSKLTMAGGRVQVNTAAFYYDYKNLQAQGTIKGGAGGVTNLFALQNIGNAKNYGAEIDLQAAPTDRINLAVGTGYLNARITDPHIAEVRPGGRPALSPLWNANGRARYTVFESAAARYFIQGDFSFKGTQYFDIYESPFLRESAYWLWNGDVGVESADSKWRATVWGRNLADREYRSGGFSGGVAGPVSMFGQPRTYGVSFSYHYN